MSMRLQISGSMMLEILEWEVYRDDATPAG